MAFFFFLHLKLYLVVESTEVVQKFYHFFLAMGPDDESVIYISEPAYLACVSLVLLLSSQNPL